MNFRRVLSINALKSKRKTFLMLAMLLSGGVASAQVLVKGNVYGGCELGQVTGDASVTVSGGTVGTPLSLQDRVIDNNTQILQRVDRGNVYGGGDGYITTGSFEPDAGLVQGNTTVTVGGNAVVRHAVYGGGNIATVGVCDVDDDGVATYTSGGETSVTIEGTALVGPKLEDLTRTPTVDELAWAQTYFNDNTIDEAKYKALAFQYLGGNEGWAFGGSRGFAGEANKKLSFVKTTSVIIQGSANVLTVFGGGENGHVQNSTDVTVKGSAIVGGMPLHGSGSITVPADSGPYEGASFTATMDETYEDEKFGVGPIIYRGNVFGGGKGTDFSGGLYSYTAGRVYGNSNVTVEGNAQIYNRVFGGGALASVGTFKCEDASNEHAITGIVGNTGHAYVTIKGGTIGSDYDNVRGRNNGEVFGGSRGGAGRPQKPTETTLLPMHQLVDIAYVGHTHVIVEGGHILHSVYGGAANGHVQGNSNVLIKETTAHTTYIGVEGQGTWHGNVYGGGGGTAQYTDTKPGTTETFTHHSITAGRVFGDATVNIQGGKVWHNVYGGGSLASVGTYLRTPGLPYESGGNTYVTITGGEIGSDGNENGMVYGSGRGEIDAPDAFMDSLTYAAYSHVTIGTDGGNFDDLKINGSVYGSGENGHVYLESHIDIYSGTIGCTATEAAALSDDAFSHRGNVYGAGCGTDKYDSNNDGIRDAYNPNSGYVQGVTYINIHGGYISRNVYGGGAQATVGMFTKKATHTYVSGQSYQDDPSLSWPYDLAFIQLPDGNGNNFPATEPTGKTNINITGGHIGTVVRPTTSGDVYGSARGDAVGALGLYEAMALARKTEITINFTPSGTEIADGTPNCIVGSVYGSGENGSVYEDTKVTLTNGLIGGSIYGGGKGTDTYHTTLWDQTSTTTPPATIEADVRSITAGKVYGNTEVIVNNGTVKHNVYGGGNLASVGKGNYIGYGEMNNPSTNPPIAPATPYYANSGKCTVTINGGTIGTDGLPNSAGIINGFVFGSSKGATFPPVNKNPRYEYTRDFFLGYANETDVTIGSSTGSGIGPTIHGSVFGGGEDGHVRWNTVVTVNKGTIGEAYVASNPETDSINKWIYRGNVYGAGRGIDYYNPSAPSPDFCSSAGSVTLNTTVTVKGGTIHRNVYGGGSNASVGPPPTGYNPGTSLCTVNIEGGTIGQKNNAGLLVYGGHVFGAGRGHRDLLNTNNIGIIATSNETQVNIKTGADVYGNVYGGGEIGQVKDDALVNMMNGTVEGTIYGGGKGEEIDEKAALVLGNATVDMTGGQVERSIYGGGELGSVGTYTEYTTVTYPDTHVLNPGDEVAVPKTCDHNTGLATVRISGGWVGHDGTLMPVSGSNSADDDRGYVFAGGRGEADTIAYYKALALGVVRETHLEVNKPTSGASPVITASVYGGCENGLVLEDTYVGIAGGQIGTGYNGNSTDPWDDPYDEEDDWGVAIAAVQSGNVAAINAATARFHECHSWPNGDGNGHYYVYDYFYGQHVDPDNLASPLYQPDYSAATGSDGHSFFGNVFGGGSGYYPIAPGVWRRTAGRVCGNTHVEITGGHILTSVYGGNETTDVMGKCTVTMSGGTLGVPRDSTSIAQHPTTCYLFGAGMGDARTAFNTWSNVNEVEVNVTGGTIFGSVFGGGEDGHVLGDAVVNIGCEAEKSPLIGTLGYSYVDGNVFGGGRGFQGIALTAGVVRGNVEVNIMGGTMLGSIYGGGRLASVGTYLVADNNDNYGKMIADNNGTAEKHGHIKINIGGTNQKSDITIGNNHESRDHYVDHTNGGNVYGGGMGRLELLGGATNPNWHQMGRVKNTVVNIGEKSGNSTVIKGDVFGGGEMGTVGGEVANTTDWHGTKVNISGGTLWFDVFGGGHGSENLTKKATISTSPLVEVTPAQMAGRVFGNTNVNVSGGWIKKCIYGGGELASVGRITDSIKHTSTTGYEESWPYQFNYVANTGIDSISVTGGRIGITGKDYFGPWAEIGNVWKPVKYDSEGHPVALTTAEIKDACKDNGDIYGGSMGKVGSKYASAHWGNVSATEIKIQYLDNNTTPSNYNPTTTDMSGIKYMTGYYPSWSDWQTWITANSTNGAGANGCIAGAVYGGAEDGHVNGDTKITLNQGLVGHAVYGGGKGKGKYTPSNSTTAQYSPTAGKVYGDTHITINGGYVVRSVFGGGNLASVGKGNYIGYGENAADMAYANNSGRTYVNIYGGQLGTLNPTKPSDAFKDQIPYGSVFGGCRGMAHGEENLNDHRLGFVNNSFVTIGETATAVTPGSTIYPRIYGSVYGGAQDGHVRRNTKVTVNDGEIGVAYGATPEVAHNTMGVPVWPLSQANLLDGNIGLDDPNWTDRGNVFGGGSGLGLLDEDGSTTASTNYALRAGCVFETTEVEIKGGLVHRGVYGGGNLASVLGTGDAPGHDKVKVTVSDNAKVGLQTDIAGEYIVPNAGPTGHDTTIYFSYGGNVFGAGKGFASDDFTTFCNVINTGVTISGGYVYGDVYGGGENGHVTDNTDVKITGTASVGILIEDDETQVNGDTWGGTTTYDGNVFGGGMGSGAIVDIDPGTPVVNEFRIYKHCGRVGGNTHVTMDGGAIQGTIYGGGRLALVGVDENGEITAFANETTHVYDSVSATTGKHGLATIEVSGTASIGNPNGDKLLNGSDESVGDIFGSGKGDVKNYQDIMAGRVANTKINITGSPRIYGSVFGGGEMAGIGYWYESGSKTKFYEKSGTAVVTIGRVNQSDNPEIGTDMEFRYDYAHGNPSYWTVFDSNHKLIHTCTGNVFGGSQGDVDTIAGHWVSMARSRMSYVTINGGTIKSRVFGGAEQGSVAGNTRVIINKNENEGSTLIIGSWANSDVPANKYLFGGVYGGGYGSHNPKFNGTTMQVDGVTTAVVNDSTTYLSNNLWTANYLAGRVYGNTRVDVLGGEIKGDVYGGASFAYIGGYGINPQGDVFLNIGKMVSANNYEGEARIYGSVYGSNNNSGTPYGNVELNVYKTAHWVWTENEVNYTNFVPTLPSGCEEWTHELLIENTNGTDHFDKKQGYAIKEVFGGGNRASYIPNMTARGSSENARSTTVHIWSCDNTIEDVYGGSNASDIGTSDKNADINLTVDGGRFKRIFTGGNGRMDPSNVYGWANNAVNGGIVEEVYGGGNADGFILQPNLVFNNPASGCTEYIDEIFGGSNEAPIVGDIVTTIECGDGFNYEFYGGTHEAVIYGNITLNVHGGETKWLFGGSRGTADKPADIMKYPSVDLITQHLNDDYYPTALINLYNHDREYYANHYAGTGGNVTVNLYGGTVTNVFGGSNINGNIEGQIVVNVIDEEGSCPLDITNLYGGGNVTDYTPLGHTASTPITSPVVNVVHIKETAENLSVTPQIPYIPGIRGDVFGASLGSDAEVKANPVVNIGYNASMTGIPSAYLDRITNSTNPHPITPRVLVCGNVYGGGDDGPVDGTTTVNVYDGEIGVIEYRKVSSEYYNTIEHISGGSVFGGGQGNLTNPDDGLVKGNSNVSMSGGIVYYNVYGGGEMSSVGLHTVSNGDFLPDATNGKATVNITGGQVGPAPKLDLAHGYNIPIGLRGFDGYVFGGGKGKGDDGSNLYKAFANVNETEVVINIPMSTVPADSINNRIWGSVFGGAEDGHVLGSNTVKYQSGYLGTTGTTSYDGNIFGGGRNYRKMNYTAGRTRGNNTIEMTGGQIFGNIYGGGRLALTGIDLNGQIIDDEAGSAGAKFGKTLVQVKGGIVGNNRLIETFSDHSMGSVYGGGMGSLEGLPSPHPTASILLLGLTKNTEVQISEIDPTNHPTHVYGVVFGGGEIANVGKYTWSVDNTTTPPTIYNINIEDNTGLAKVSVTGGVIGGDRTRMRYDLADPSDPTNYWLMYNDDLGYVYGGGEGWSEDPDKYDKVHAEGLDDPETSLIDLISTVKSTEVEISGGWVKASVFGGAESGHVRGNTKVTIKGGQIGAGNGTVDELYTDGTNDTPNQFINPATTPVTTENSLKGTAHWDYGRDNGSGTKVYHPFDPAKIRNQYNISTSTYGYVPCDGRSWFGNVFGGGSGWFPYVKNEGTETAPNFVSYWNSNSGRVWGNTEVIITGGHILNNVYGANEMTDVGEYGVADAAYNEQHPLVHVNELYCKNENTGRAKVTISGGTIGVPRTVTQVMEQPITSSVFGGGAGDPRIIFNDKNNVDTTDVLITGGIIYGSVYGGAEQGHIVRGTSVRINEAAGKTIVIGSTGFSGYDGCVFGGGKGDETVYDSYSTINANPPTIPAEIPAHPNFACGRVGGTSKVAMSKGTVLGNLYGGGMIALTGVGKEFTGVTGDNGDGFWSFISGTPGNYVYDYIHHGLTQVVVTGGTIGNHVNNGLSSLLNTRTVGNVFGGGRGKIDEFEEDDFGRAARAIVNISGSPTIYGSVFGGGQMANVGHWYNYDTWYTTGTGHTQVIITGNPTIGTAKEFDNGYATGTGASTPINTIYETINNVRMISHTSTGNVYGGGQGNVTLKNSSTVVGLEQGHCRTTDVNISGTPTIMSSVFGGSEQGVVWGDTKVNIDGGTIGKTGIVSHRWDNVNNQWVDANTPYSFGSVFGGSYGADKYMAFPAVTLPESAVTSINALAGRVYGNATVSITGGTVRGNVFGGGDMASVGQWTEVKDNSNNLIDYAPVANTGKATVDVSGTAIIGPLDGTGLNGYVFGGGRGIGNDPDNLRNKYCNVNSTEVTINLTYENVDPDAADPETLWDEDTDGRIYGSVYGGGSSSHVLGDATVTINGGIIGTYDAVHNTITDWGGNVFGSGRNFHMTNYAAGRVAGNTTVEMNNGVVYGSIFGGGRNAVTGTGLDGMTMRNDVADNQETTEVNEEETYGKTTVMVKGGTVGYRPLVTSYLERPIGEVFGGGKGSMTPFPGHPAASPLLIAMVKNTEVEISQANDDVPTYVLNTVYGGGEVGNVGQYTWVQDPDTHVISAIDLMAGTGTTNVTIKGGRIGMDRMVMSYELVGGTGQDRFNPKTNPVGNVFGGGKGVSVDPLTYCSNPSGEPDINTARFGDKYLIDLMATCGTTTVVVKDTLSYKPWVKSSVYGGSACGHVVGNTNVTIAGGQIGAGDSGTADLNPYEDDKFVDASSTTINDENSLKPTCHWDYDPNTLNPFDLVEIYNGIDASGNYTYVPTDGKTWYGNVYGGGSGFLPYIKNEGTEENPNYVSHWNRESGKVYGNSTVTITGGHILSCVYGGCEVSDVGLYRYDPDIHGDVHNTLITGFESNGTATINMSGGTVGVPRTTTQIQAHPIPGYVYGSGKGDPRIYFNTWTNVNASAITMTGGKIYGSLFGGGEDGHVLDDVTISVSETSNTNPTIIGSTGLSKGDGNIFGGGRGTTDEAHTAGSVGGNVTLNITNGKMLGNIYGGGDRSSVGIYLVDAQYNGGSGMVDNPLYGTFQDGVYHGKTTVTVSGGNIGTTTNNITTGHVFGGGRGSNKKDTSGDLYKRLGEVKNTDVTINGSVTVNGSVYGGGENGQVNQDTKVTIDGSAVIGVDDGGNVQGYVYGGGYGVDPYSGTDPAEDNPYAGRVSGTTRVNINGGTVTKHVLGGGEKGLVNTARIVNINGGTVKGHVLGGNNMIPVVEGFASNSMKTVNVRGGAIEGSVFGGSYAAAEGNDADTWNSFVNITGGTIGYASSGNTIIPTGNVYAAGYGGEVNGSVTLNVGLTAVKESPNHSANTHYQDGLNNADPTPAKVKIQGNLFDGSYQYQTQTGTNWLYEFDITGHSNMYIDGYGYNTANDDENSTDKPYMNIGGGLYGGGNYCESGKLGRKLILRNYGQRVTNDDGSLKEVTRTLTTLQRAGIALIDNSNIQFTGEADLSQTYTDRDRFGVLTVDDGLYIANGSSFVLGTDTRPVYMDSIYELKSLHLKLGTSYQNSDAYTTGSGSNWEWIGVNSTDPNDPSANTAANARLYYSETGTEPLTFAHENVILFNGDSRLWVRYKNASTGNKVMYGELQGFFRIRADQFTPNDNKSFAYARPKLTNNVNPLPKPDGTGNYDNDNRDDGGFLSYVTTYNDFTKNGQTILGYPYEHDGDDGGSAFTKTKQYPYYNFAEVTAKGNMEEYRAWVLPLLEGHIWYVDGRGIGSTTHGWGQDKSHEFGWGDRPDKPKQTITKNDPANNTYGIFYDPSTLSQFNPNRFNPEKDIIFVVGPVQALVENGDLNPSMSNSDPAKRYQLKLYRYPGGHLMSNGQMDATTSANQSTHVPTSTDYNGLADGLTDGPGANLGAMVNVNNTTGNFVMENVLVDGMFREGSFTSEEILAYSIPATYYNTYTYNETQHPAEKLNVSEPLVVTQPNAQLTLKGGTVLQHGYNNNDASTTWYYNPDYPTTADGLHHGALYVDENATVNMEGLVTITGNKQKNGTGATTECNVYLPTFDKSLTITDAMDVAARIGVTSPIRNTSDDYRDNTLSPVAVVDMSGAEPTDNGAIASTVWSQGNFLDDQDWFFGNGGHTTYYDNLGYEGAGNEYRSLYFGWTWANVVREAPSGFDVSNIDSKEDLAWLISLNTGMNGATATNLSGQDLLQKTDLDMKQYVWVPIGDDSHNGFEHKSFAGHFDGQGHLIKNINIDYIGRGDTRYEHQDYGLFGHVNGSVERTFVVSGTVSPKVSIDLLNTDMFNIGGLAGGLQNATLANSEAALHIYAPDEANYHVAAGGLVAKVMPGGEIHSSMAMPVMETTDKTVENATGASVGGLVGNAAGGNVYNSFVNAQFNVYGNPKAGGLMGSNDGAKVENCYVAFNNTPTEDLNFDGLVSDGYSDFDSCYVQTGYPYMGVTEDRGHHFTATNSSDLYGYMYKDNTVKKSATVAGATVDTAMFRMLNHWVDGRNKTGNKYARWSRPGLSEINGDYPVLLLDDIDGTTAHQGDFSTVATIHGTNVLQYGGTVRDGKQLDGAIERMVAGSAKDAGDALFVYGDITETPSKNPASNTKISIQEDVAIMDPGTLSAYDNTYVGITFDNSFGKATATPGMNDGLFGSDNLDLPRDWHMFSTPLSNAPLGFDYLGDNVAGSQHKNNPWENPDGEFSWLDGTPANTECAGDRRYWMKSYETADGYFPTTRGYALTGNVSDWFIENSDECPSSGTTFLNRYPYGMDFYTWNEPEYHWINFKRNGPNHWHSDTPHVHLDYKPAEVKEGQTPYTTNQNEDNLIVGRGYMAAIATETFMQSHGLLNAGDQSIILTNNGWKIKGWNMVGNPFHGYLDFNELGKADGPNKDVLTHHDNNGEDEGAFYVIYDADKYQNRNASTAYRYYPVKGSPEGADYADRFLHPHQGFYVKTDTHLSELKINENMLVTREFVEANGGSHFRATQPSYPLVNLYLNSDKGCADVTVIEFERPEWGGARKVKELRVGDGLFYAHHGDTYYAALFAKEGIDRVPLWFEAKEDDIFTMKWNMANGNFHSMYLIDNITGVQYDMLRNDTYTFEGHKEDYPSRFLIVFDLTDVEEFEDDNEHPFAFFNGSEWVVTGEGDLEFIDMLGRVLAKSHISGQNRITLPMVADGPYLFRLTNHKETRIQKVIVTK